MDTVTIYDTVNRRYAGFSKALEDIHGVRTRKDLVRYQDFSKKLSPFEFHFIHLFHRFTGSGASFQPTYIQSDTGLKLRNPKEHGYYNNHVETLARCGSVEEMVRYIVQCSTPMVTSVGNQPPSLKNGDPSKYRLAQQYYFDNYAIDFVRDYYLFITQGSKSREPLGIKECVDFCCNWHKERGFKQWHFVLTAFVMDSAEYYPQWVNPESHCYYGANCVRAFDLMYEKEKTDPKKRAEYEEQCMTHLCKSVSGRPYDVEDVCCDYIRYITEYIPKGYEDLPNNLRQNRSSLKVQTDHGLEYPIEIVKRIQEVCG